MGNINIKKFLTYDEQIKLLESKRLTIANYDFAVAQLKSYGYFNLISGYKRLFKGKDGSYKLHTDIENIGALYIFDNELRKLILPIIFKIENQIKSLISYSFCLEHGEQQKHYLNANNYSYTDKNQDEINILIEKLNEVIKSNNNSITHQKDKYGNVPLWVLMKNLTLGTVSKMYSLLPQNIQISVSKEFEHINEQELSGILDFLTRYRNICAHNERLFDYKYQKRSIRETYIHKKYSIEDKGRNDIFALIIIFKLMINEGEFMQFIKNLDTVLNLLLDQNRVLQKTQIYKALGLTENWLNVVSG